MLLEGLAANWGLYFAARTPDKVGANDLSQVLESLQRSLRLKDLPRTNNDTILAENCAYADKRLLQPLFSRLHIFVLFLWYASDQPGGITEEDKERWLLLQVAPETLVGVDIFSKLTIALRGASTDTEEVLSTKIRDLLVKIDTFLPGQRVTCVIDEAQYPAHLLTTKFLSSNREPRPVLRELFLKWQECLGSIIVAGTGISMSDIEVILNSTASKDIVTRHEVITETGAFDETEDQRDYLDKYFPSGYFDDEAGQLLLSRIGYWLHGRWAVTSFSYSKCSLPLGIDSLPPMLLESLPQASSLPISY
jgi:hypothetical protein